MDYWSIGFETHHSITPELHYSSLYSTVMDYQRSDRVGDLLIELVSELLRREVRDPRVGAVTLTGAKVSKDLRHARIYFNLLGGHDDREAASAGLKSATGFIRSRVGKQLKLKFVPTIEFVYDETEDEAKRIDDLLRQVKH
jgi:ribosome-binding factor A